MFEADGRWQHTSVLLVYARDTSGCCQLSSVTELQLAMITGQVKPKQLTPKVHPVNNLNSDHCVPGNVVLPYLCPAGQ